MERPSILLVTVDSLRADHLNPYGYRRDTSPNLSAISKKGWTFENAYSVGPNTHPSFPGILTSTYPSLFPRGEVSGYLEPERVTVQEVLQKAGYRTGGFHSNPFLSRFFGYHRGFHRFDDFLITKRARIVDKGSARLSMKLKRAWDIAVERKPPFARAKEVNERAMDWLEMVEEPYFLWVHYMDVHMPYLPPPGYLKKTGGRNIPYLEQVLIGNRLTDGRKRNSMSEGSVKKAVDLYDACIRYVDDALGALMKRVERMQSGPLIAIITADHGEEFMDHGGMGHTQRLFEELVKVPLFVNHPRARRKRVEKVVSLIDIPPFILNACGAAPPSSFMGTDLLEKMSSEKEHPAFFETQRKGGLYSGFRKGDCKYVSGDKELLFNLKEDPKEKHNIAMKERRLLVECNKTLQAHRKEVVEKRKRLLMESDRERIRRTVERSRGRI